MQTLPPITGIATIGDVVAAIERIIEWSIANASRLGYFAALYKRITVSIQKNLPEFQNPARMETLDVVFASRYFAALNAWFWPAQFPPLSHAWRVAFQAASLPGPIIVQHLLAGVNAHIDIDLGIAAETVSPGASLPDLKSDFDLVNQVLGAQVGNVLAEIDELSPLLGDLYDLFHQPESGVIDRILDSTRAEAWDFAGRLAATPPAQQPATIAERDATVAAIGASIIRPPFLIDEVIRGIGLREQRDAVTIIRTLNAQAERVAHAG